MRGGYYPGKGSKGAVMRYEVRRKGRLYYVYDERGVQQQGACFTERGAKRWARKLSQPTGDSKVVAAFEDGLEAPTEPRNPIGFR